MAVDLFFNAASTTVSSGGTTAPAAGTTEAWTVASSATFFDVSGETAITNYRQFRVVDPADTSAQPEIIRVTNVRTVTTTNDTWDVVRGAENTTPVAHAAGFTVKAIATSATLSGIPLNWWGTMSDGDVTISTTVSLSREMHYRDLTVASGGVLKPNGYRIFYRTLTVQAGGAVSGDANSATTSAGAAAVGARNTVALTGGAGGNGNVSTAGANGGGPAINNPCWGGAGIVGGNGGAGSSSAGGNGAAAATNMGSNFDTRQFWLSAMSGVVFPGNAAPGGYGFGGVGGGGGGGDGTNAGGGGGGGGSGIILIGRRTVNNGAITAKGGNGAPGTGGNAGGGGSGSGGLILIATASFEGTAPTASFGSPGAGAGTGASGTWGTSPAVTIYKVGETAYT